MAVFYDTEWRRAQVGGETSEFPHVHRDLPSGWRALDDGEWLLHIPGGIDLPGQGWKVHVASVLDNAERLLDKIWDYCIDRQLAFKFLRSRDVLRRRNAKEAARGHSGKFVTIYPLDVTQMELVCKELDELLRGEPGPYILSDLRWGDGPVHVRYGGFVDRRYRSASGVLVPAIEDDTGTLVPDERPPAFTVPPWVELPACLVPHLEARNAVTVSDLPYRIDRALLFSNGGGVYVGSDARTGERVVLKEARPHAGLSSDGADAVTRLRREHETLRRLAGLPGVPRVRDLVTVGEHSFLVMDHIEGKPLNRRIAVRNPGLGRATDPDDAAEYARWCVDVCAAVERIVRSMHERGVVYADLHPRNVLVGPDDTVAALVDYEVAFDAGSSGRQELAAPGYRAPSDRRGVEVDDYTLACLRLGMFLPLTPLCELCPEKARELADAVAERYPVSRAWLDAAVRTIVGERRPGSGGQERSDGPGGADGPGDPTIGPLSPGSADRHPTPPAPGAGRLSLPVWRAAEPGGWPATRDGLVRAIVASATPERDDRLFPGDRAQFRTGGLNLAHGAAGVLYALSVTGGDRGVDPDQRERYVRWLVDHATAIVPDPRLGLYDGYHGVAHVLDLLGHRVRALDVLDLCLAERWETVGHGLRDGLAGIGLNLAHLARTCGDSRLHAAALHAADVLVGRLAEDDDPSDVSGGGHPYAGLMRGWSGPALLFIRLYEATGDRSLLEHAATALRRDLRRCVARDDDHGTLQVNEGWRTMPYLATGSVGIGLVLDAYLAHQPDEQFAEASAAIDGAACSWVYVEPGLFEGRAGMVTYLASRRAAAGTAGGTGGAGETGDRGAQAEQGACARQELLRQVDRLGWHALGFGGGVAFPGDQLLHLSMDLATGTAGVLLALGTAFHDRPAHLPFLSPSDERKEWR